MSIRRGYIAAVDHFTTIPNAWLRDDRLSRRARGLLCELMSHRPGWETSVEKLVQSGPEGRDAIRTALVELENCGYLARVQERDGGQFGGVDYVITDPAENPQVSGEDSQVNAEGGADSPSSVFPSSVKPTSADPHPKKNIFQKTNQKNTIDNATADAFEDFWRSYPRKVAKPAALRAWRSSVKNTDPASVMAGLKTFRFSDDPKFIPHAATWLNQRRWEDEPEGPVRAASQPPAPYQAPANFSSTWTPPAAWGQA